MECPVCKGVVLRHVKLEKNLPAAHCPQCGGHWIGAEEYHAWLATLGEAAREASADAPEAVDTPRALVCPQCDHLMLKYRVGRDIAFRLDQCGQCGGFWFDRNEWEALKARNLHDDIHRVVTAQWQRAARMEASQQRWQRHYASLFGTEDYTEIRRVKTWLSSHDQRAALLAYLNDENPYSGA